MEIVLRVQVLCPIINHRHDFQCLWETVHRLLDIRADTVEQCVPGGKCKYGTGNSFPNQPRMEVGQSGVVRLQATLSCLLVLLDLAQFSQELTDKVWKKGQRYGKTKISVIDLWEQCPPYGDNQVSAVRYTWLVVVIGRSSDVIRVYYPIIK